MRSSATLEAGRIVVTGIGMCTPLGRSVQACAAARAGISRAGVLPNTEAFFPDGLEPEELTGHAVRGVTDGFTGAARILRLVQPALSEALAAAEHAIGGRSRTSVFFALPSFHASRAVRMRESGSGGDAEVETELTEVWLTFRESLTAFVGSELGHSGPVEFFFAGQGGTLQAIAAAVEHLRSGASDVCVVCGADTMVDPGVLPDLRTLDLVRTSEQPQRFLPGEAAAAVVMERWDGASARGATPLGALLSTAWDDRSLDRFHEDDPHGEGFTAAIAAAVQNGGADPRAFGRIMTDLNGDSWKAMDWAYAMIGLGPSLAELPQDHVGEHFGETGAAAPLLAFCLVVRGWVGGYAPGDALVVTGSYGSTRGAAWLGQVAVQG